jgi:hypothetical protein
MPTNVIEEFSDRFEFVSNPFDYDLAVTLMDDMLDVFSEYSDNPSYMDLYDTLSDMILEYDERHFSPLIESYV